LQHAVEAISREDLLKSSIVRVVDACSRYPWRVIVIALILAAAAGAYAARHFAIKTDINDLFPHDLSWTKRADDFQKAFKPLEILVVVDAPTPELAGRAADRLASGLAPRTDLIRSVRQPQSGEFFERNGLLFLPTDEVERVTDGLGRADALLETLSMDPSLRGSLDALSFGLLGVDRKELELDSMVRPLTMASDTVEAVLARKPASFSWQVLAGGKPAEPRDLRRFVEVDPVLDFTALEPGRAATDAIVKTAADLKLATDYQARVRLTGLVPIDDDEFGTIREHAELNITFSLLAVLIILWLALKSPRIIFAVVVSLAVGLFLSTALGLMLVGALNVISVAFFMLFVGLGVDFGIQFSVRYRAERHDFRDLHTALVSAARKAGGPLALAAVGTTVGFCSFVPTAYRGLGELGEIAGSSMVIAFLTSITLLPALLAVLNPPSEPHPMGFAALAPIDRFLERHRVGVIVSIVAIVLLGAPLLMYLPFDFNPLHLRSPKVESVATFLQLRKDRETGANAIEIMEPNLAAANATAQRLSGLPEVSEARTLQSFVPADQPRKLQLIADAASKIDASLNPKETDPPPSDAENVDALKVTAGHLAKIAANHKGPGADAAGRLSGLLTRLAEADPSLRQAADTAIVAPLKLSLDRLRKTIKPQPVTVDTIPPDIARAWVTADGRARVQVLPKGDPDDTAVLRRFVTAVLRIVPEATGPAVLLYEAANTIVRAFIEAGAFALIAIAILLYLTLRRTVDVLLTLVPLIVAGIVTLELCVIIDLPLNFANVIALPLLLGVGVAFKIYYIMAWRSGKTALVQSSLSRAVIFSAMTTATAFGSLWLSSHPGTSSMGKLMALALVCTMAAAVLFQPALMGPPREKPAKAK
jgi:hopanoid biosynthesis associated RND transporter like protein HpnN